MHAERRILAILAAFRRGRAHSGSSARPLRHGRGLVLGLQTLTSMSADRPLDTLDALTAAAHTDTWSARTDVDWWGAAPVVPDGVAVADYVDTISQLFHAEKAALAMATDLAARVPEPGAHAFLVTQIADEDRHAQVHRMYLERLGDVAPLDPALADVLAAARGWAGAPWVQVAALDLMLPLEIMPPLRRRMHTWPCRLLRQLNRKVAQDERRHAAFGKRYLELLTPTLAPDERAAGLAALDDLWHRWREVSRARRRGAVLHPDRAELERVGDRLRALLRRFRLVGPTPAFARAA